MTSPIPPRRRLWLRLAAFGAFGVILTHAAQLLIANRTTTHALVERLTREGQILAGLVARQASAALARRDPTRLRELVDATARTKEVSYCFVQRDGRVLASSFARGTPTALLGVAHRDGVVIVRASNARYLDVRALVPGSGGALVRIGIGLSALEPPLYRQGLSLGLVALAVALVGIIAAFVIGRRITRPLDQMVAALERIDPAEQPEPLPQLRDDEIGYLTDKVNQMRERLFRAHRAQEAARLQQMRTEKLASLGTLVAGVAHEVNNPLAGLKNCQWRLRKDDLSPERREEYLEMMGESLERIEQVVKQLLNFSRIRQPKREAVVVGDLLASARALVEAAAGAAHVRVEVAGDEGSRAAAEVAVSVDRHQIEQALLNLLLNAIYVSPREDVVTLRAVLDGEQRRVALAVCDRGPGIAPEVASKIEDPFFTTKPEGEGTGLGLSVTRTIVDAHGGDLTFAAREDGAGTEATLWLPIDGAPGDGGTRQ
ncbi:MAG: HAMP domain-containing protein [Myxococcales bacterium]|nr:HAMP domain-containing protein [Myxococcales bacterium]